MPEAARHRACVGARCVGIESQTEILVVGGGGGGCVSGPRFWQFLLVIAAREENAPTFRANLNTVSCILTVRFFTTLYPLVTF